MTKEKMEEIYFIRSIACLCVVFVHSITRVIDLYGSQLTQVGTLVFLSLRLVFTFGTPIFIFLSEFLIAYSYSKGIPKDFMDKRVKYIFYPYVSMAFLYAGIMIYEGDGLQGTLFSNYLLNVASNLVFGFYRHGYFILVIFQFYFLHMLLYKKLQQWNPKLVLTITFFINTLYLGFFSFVEPLNIPYGQQLWRGLSWGSFPAWIFYFSLGYYTGRNYELFKEKLREYHKAVKILPIMTIFLVLYFFLSEMITINSSKRLDMLFFSISMIFLLFYVSNKIIKIPVFFPWLSDYSFGIYLFHMFYLSIMTKEIQGISYQHINPILMLFLLMIVSSTASILTTYIFSKVPMGNYIVGRVVGGVNKRLLIHNNYNNLRKVK